LIVVGITGTMMIVEIVDGLCFSDVFHLFLCCQAHVQGSVLGCWFY